MRVTTIRGKLRLPHAFATANKMNDAQELASLIRYASPNVNKFRKSLVGTLVCELRFPTLLEFGDSSPPAVLVKRLRKKYPQLEKVSEVTFSGEFSGGKPLHSHVLRSLRGSWAVSVKQSSLSVESASYSGYADLKARVQEVLDAAKDVIDSDFWTRIGLRYMNTLRNGAEESFEGWLNPELVAPILSEGLGLIDDFQGRIVCGEPSGRAGFLLQHGIKRDAPREMPKYNIDIDAYYNEVSLGDTISILDGLHGVAFNVFDWSLGDKARQFLYS